MILHCCVIGTAMSAFLGKYSQLFFLIQVKSTPNQTLISTAIWMLPTDSVYGIWPKSGEIDVMEHVGYEVGKVHGSIHSEAYNHMKNTQKTGTVLLDVMDWHVYEIIWTEDKIQYLADNSVYYEFKKDAICCREINQKTWPFNQDFHLLINVAVGGSWGGKKGVDEKEFEGDGQVMSIDWVRVYDV